MHSNEIDLYIDNLTSPYSEIAQKLRLIIDRELIHAHSKIWHAHPVWFIDENPITGFSLLKSGLRLLFWSGQSFDEELLIPEGKFKAAELRFNAVEDILENDLIRILNKAQTIQWDYKNLIKRKGVLERLM